MCHSLSMKRSMTASTFVRAELISLFGFKDDCKSVSAELLAQCLVLASALTVSLSMLAKLRNIHVSDETLLKAWKTNLPADCDELELRSRAHLLEVLEPRALRFGFPIFDLPLVPVPGRQRGIGNSEFTNSWG